MFSDDCSWDTPTAVKVLNETIFSLHPHRKTLKGKKRSCIDSDTKQQSDADNSLKTYKAQKDTSVVPAVLSQGHPKQVENKVSANHYSVDGIKKKRHKHRRSLPSANDGETCHVLSADQYSLPTVTKPYVQLKTVKSVKKSLKSVHSNSTSESTSQPAASNNVHEALALDTSVSSMRRKRKPHSTDIVSSLKPKKSRTLNSKSAKVHAVADKYSAGPVKCNFDIVKLRSTLEKHGRFSGALPQQGTSRLHEKVSRKKGTSQINQETATTSTKHEKVDTNVSANGNSSPHSETLSSGSLLTERMRSRLASARFRFINEQMYRSTGSEAAEMFAHDADAFTVYHAGFQSQVSKWPINPIDRMIDYISSSGTLAVVADFGCGDAKIARSVPNTVHSFDLMALNEHVTACNMAHVPLKKASVDITVSCLSLMGTDIVQYLVEASRVLKLGGILLIAEVVSRFEKIGSFVRKLRRLGFELENKVVNKMFVWFELKKIGEISASSAEECLPSIELYPCVYKKR